MNSKLLLYSFIAYISAGFYPIRLTRVIAFMESFGIQKVQNPNLTMGTDLLMLAGLVGLQDPHQDKLDHYFDCNGRIIGNLDQTTQPEHETIWELFDEYRITYNKNDTTKYCGQSLGVGVYFSEFGRPIVNDILMIKNNKDSNAHPKCISADESCEPVLNVFKVVFPAIYLKIKGYNVYYSDNCGPSTGRSGDFAVFIALWNAVHKKPAKQVIFTGEIRDYGLLHPVGDIMHKLQVSIDLDIPIAVEHNNYQEILFLLAQKTFHSSHAHIAFLVENLVLLISINERISCNLDQETLHKIYKYGSQINKYQGQRENIYKLKIISIISILSIFLIIYLTNS
jgi:hypothetical protein